MGLPAARGTVPSWTPPAGKFLGSDSLTRELPRGSFRAPRGLAADQASPSEATRTFKISWFAGQGNEVDSWQWYTLNLFHHSLIYPLLWNYLGLLERKLLQRMAIT